MEPILMISNLVLIGITGTYAWLANKSVKQLQQEGEYYRNVVEKQLQFTALPHLYWDLRVLPSQSPLSYSTEAGQAASQIASSWREGNPLAGRWTTAENSLPGQEHQGGASGGANSRASNRLALEVFNISNVPAYDVHVSLIAAYTEENLGIATFLRTHVQPRHRKYPLQSDKVGYYGVRNAVRLSLLPTQQKIVLSLPFPIRPVDVYTLVQYRELSGNNYYQVCCFSAIDESGTYRANILEPSAIQTMERLHLFDLEDFALPEGPSDLKAGFPYYLADFIDLWNHSISSRLILDASGSPDTEVPVQATYDF